MFINVTQNSDEWFDLRLGRATSSNFGKIMANEDKAFGIPAKEYAQKIALERVTGVRDESSSYTNASMLRGHELEPIACELYEIETFTTVTNGGFNSYADLGDSPDGNVGDNGCIEIKSVIPTTHWKRLKLGGFDTAYQWQIHGHIWLGKKEYCDFVSYCPEMPNSKQLYIHRIERDEEIIERMKIRLNDFIKLVEQNVEILEA